jgi:lysophospholipase
VHSFDDYVNDYVYFVTRIIQNDRNKLKIYAVSHSMGGFIAAVAMARNPSIISKAVLCAPMLRMKCATRAMNYRFPVPQPVAHWLAYLSWVVGLGTAHGVGYPNEVCTDKMARDTFTSDEARLEEMEALREKHPNAIATCVTNDWIRKSLELQIEFSKQYGMVRTNCLILNATKDYFVYNRAMEAFADTAVSTRLATVPDSYHDLLFESDDRRIPVENQIIEYLSQASDDISQLRIDPMFDEYNSESKAHLRPSLMSLGETIVRGSCLAVGTLGIVIGLSMVTGINTDGIYRALFKKK